MMREQRRGVLAAVVLASALAGCVSLKRTPEARFFVLRSLAEPPASSSSPSGQVGVLPVRLPGHLERPQLVTEVGPHEVRVDEFDRWAEPLAAAATRMLAENLAILLPERRVVRYPWAAGEPTRCRVEVQLRHFGPQGDGVVRLEGRFSLLGEREERALAMRAISLRRGPLPVGPKGVEPGAGVEAMSELLSELSQAIAADVRALPGTTTD